MSCSTYQSHRKIRVAFEGGTASGKSTLLQRIAEQQPLWECHLEPVQEWKNWNGVNYLGNFQGNPTGHNRMQLDRVILESYVDIFRNESSRQTQLYERSVFSAAYIFSKVHLKMGYLEPEDVIALQELYQEKVRPLFKMDATVYLRASPDMCLKRRHARMGDTGDGIDPDGNVLGREYEEVTFECHEAVFGPDKLRQPTGTLIIDETYGEFEMDEKVQRIIRFISQTEFLDGRTYVYSHKPLPFPI